MEYSLEDKIELEAQAVTMDFDEKNQYPKGYLDGMLWAFDLVLMWMREGVKPNA